MDGVIKWENDCVGNTDNNKRLMRSLWKWEWFVRFAKSEVFSEQIERVIEELDKKIQDLVNEKWDNEKIGEKIIAKEF